MSAEPLISGLRASLKRALAGARAGLVNEASQITDAMQATQAHGDRTGATRAGYTAYVVGDGESGSQALAKAVSAVEDKNPGHSATTSYNTDAALGVVLTDPTDYQDKLERENAGAKAVLGPTLVARATDLTAAAAAGSKRALG